MNKNKDSTRRIKGQTFVLRSDWGGRQVHDTEQDSKEKEQTSSIGDGKTPRESYVMLFTNDTYEFEKSKQTEKSLMYIKNS